ncbi:MAG TPA: LCP family protein [Candidatus Limnocylindria bacterium]|nr:LCP family protein [Candidatus Limnocylindria bacterium]
MQRIHAPSVRALLGLVILLAACTPEASPMPVATSAAPASANASASLDAELMERRWTVLYVGTDHNAARESRGDPVNTDALMLVSLSPDQSDLALVSLPRDTVDVPLDEGGDVYEEKINALYREQGIDALVGAMEALYGVPIDGHVVVDMDDFTTLVEATGGVEVDPDEPLRDPIVDLDLDAGPQEIDAATAQAYVRTRVDQDYGRMARQQEVLVSMVERLLDTDGDRDLRALLDDLESLETDLPLDELATLAELARRATDADVTNLIIEPPLITFEGDRGDGRGYVLEPDTDAIREAVRSLIAD